MEQGQLEYDVSQSAVEARGHSMTDTQIASALASDVSRRTADIEGRAQVEAMLGGVAATDFAATELQRVLALPQVPHWRLAEHLAECYLSEHRQCSFPWHSGRDLKNPNSSNAGADLIGLVDADGDTCRLAFGEVKASADSSAPPSVVYSLRTQIEALLKSKSVPRCLVRYMAYRACGTDWEDAFRRAVQAYLADTGDFRTFGFVVRTTQPAAEDLRSLAEHVSQLGASGVCLIAVYSPLDFGRWREHICATGGDRA